MPASAAIRKPAPRSPSAPGASSLSSPARCSKTRSTPDRAVAAAEIPEKQYFKIGEVAKIAGVEPYVLRYWETEFRTIRPEKTRSNQRLYRRRAVETVLKIKELLYAQGYRIEGARRRL